MITGIAIENFKGIRERVELDLKPLTLLFGPNSAGKSTILHALHYAREIFERHNLDADRTVAGGDFVDLGGFHSFVHGRDHRRQVVLEFGLDLRQTQLPDYTDPYYGPNAASPDETLGSLVGEVSSASVALRIAWSELRNAAYVSQYSVVINGEPFASILCEPGRPAATLIFNDEHPVFVPGSDIFWLEGRYDEAYLQQTPAFRICLIEARELGMVPESSAELITLSGQQDALPCWGQSLTVNSEWPSGLSEEDGNFAELIEAGMSAALSQLIVGPGEVLRNILRDFRYLGPLRETPPRHFSPPRFPDPSRWASGLGAWDTLCTDGEELVGQVSDWLSDSERLNTGYRILLQNYKELDLENPLVIQLLTGRAFDEADNARLDLENLPTQTRLILVPNGSDLELRPHDVGIGISQIVPVVVTALDPTQGLAAIEQPELHIHPRLQAELGDLFIKAALGDHRHTVLLETHSELIPLRLMRRIRETHETQLPSHLPNIRSEDVAIYYVELHEGATVATRLELNEQGRLLDPWPNGFFEEGFRERFSQ